VKTDVEELSPTRVRLTVEVPFDELKPSLDQAYRDVGRQVRIPGFRPGHVPRQVLDQRIGRGAVLEQALNDAVPELYSRAVREAQVSVLGQPEVERWGGKVVALPLVDGCSTTGIIERVLARYGGNA